jgi:hypothetical protein
LLHGIALYSVQPNVEADIEGGTPRTATAPLFVAAVALAHMLAGLVTLGEHVGERGGKADLEPH